MKALIGLGLLALSVTAAQAQYGTRSYGSSGGSGLYGTGSNPNSHYVSPSIDRNGSYRSGHFQTNPNNTQLDNYGTRGNLNPYTGTYGTRSPRF